MKSRRNWCCRASGFKDAIPRSQREGDTPGRPRWDRFAWPLRPEVRGHENSSQKAGQGVSSIAWTVIPSPRSREARNQGSTDRWAAPTATIAHSHREMPVERPSERDTADVGEDVAGVVGVRIVLRLRPLEDLDKRLGARLVDRRDLSGRPIRVSLRVDRVRGRYPV